MAWSTGDGNSEPLEHADPVEQATPARSRLINSVSARQPGKERLSVWGVPPVAGPLSTTGSALARSWSRNRFRSRNTYSQGRCHPDRQVNRLGARAPALLLVAAPELGPQLDVAADQQGADAGRAVELVRAERQGGHAQRVEVERQLADRLGRVAVKPGTSLQAPDQRPHRLDRPGLVIGQQHGGQARLRPQQLGEGLLPDDAAGVHG
jgi:hypothetical protein